MMDSPLLTERQRRMYVVNVILRRREREGNESIGCALLEKIQALELAELEATLASFSEPAD